ncbi:MAG: sensor domain-containing diguanylate cyclase [Gammaproteobacteria bacterium]
MSRNAMNQPETSQRDREYQGKASLYRYMIEDSRDVVFLLDENGCFVYLNNRIRHVLGYKKEELLGVHFSKLLHPDDLKRSQTAYSQCINASGRATARGVHLRIRHKSGVDNFRYFDIKLVAVPESVSQDYIEEAGQADEAGRHRAVIYGAARDINQLKSLERIIRTNTHHDYLTGLPNRALLKDRVRHAIARARREGLNFAVMFIDLDGFKQVNDMFGHSAGDILLQSVAQRLTASLRESDTLARIGGDEFVLLLPVIRSKEEARGIARKLMREISAPFEFNGSTIPLSASIGIAVYPDNGESFERLVNAADNAMYYIKHKPKNGYALLADLPDAERINTVYRTKPD